MSKLPHVDRCPVTQGLKGECAYLWAVFLAHEADMRDDYIEYDRYKMIAEQLTPKPGIPMPSSVHYAQLEDAIEEWTNGTRNRI